MLAQSQPVIPPAPKVHEKDLPGWRLLLPMQARGAGGAAPEGRPADASARQARTTFSGEQSLTPTSAGFGNRVLVGDPLHNSAPNATPLHTFSKTTRLHPPL